MEYSHIIVSNLLGAYYLKNKDSSKALSYYEAAYKKDASDINVLRNLIMLQLQASQFDKAATLSEEALMLYPAQALFYLGYGVAQNALGNTKDAADYLEMGLDYIIDNPKMQADFYSELARAYDKLGNAAKAADYRKRLTNLTQ